MKAHMLAHDYVFANHHRTASANKRIRIGCRIRAYLNAITQRGRWRTYHGGVRPESHVGLWRSEEHTSELQSRPHLVCRLLLEKKNIQAPSGAALGRRNPPRGCVTIGP